MSATDTPLKKPQPRLHSPETIRQVLARARETSGYQAAKEFGIQHRSIYRWIAYAEQHPEWPTARDIAQWRAWERRTKAERARRAEISRIYRRRLYLQRGAPMQIDPTGTRRRLQALACLGWLWSEIGAELGVTAARVGHMAAGQWRMVHRDNARKVAEVYDRLSMTVPPELERKPHAAVIRARQRRDAARKGWAPPLAWDDATIDDPAATPTGLHGDEAIQRRQQRLEHLQQVLTAGGDLIDACNALGISRDGVNTWCRRRGHMDLYRELLRRYDQRQGKPTAEQGAA